MKKTLSRLLAAALVLAMVCAMIPAAMAATTVSVAVTSGGTTLAVGGSAVATVTVGEAVGDTTWASSNTDVATVTAIPSTNTAAIVAKKAGTTQITATNNSITSAPVTITVKCSSTCTVAGCSCTADHTSAACDCPACTAVSGLVLEKPTSLALSTSDNTKKVATLDPTTLSVKAKHACASVTDSAVALKDLTIAAVGTGIVTVTKNTTAPASMDAPTWTVTAVAAGTEYLKVTYAGFEKIIPVTVNADPDLTVTGITAANNKTYTKGETAAALTVTAAGGNGTYTYQWYKANGASAGNVGTAITTATTNTYTPSTAAVDDSWYYCKVTSNGVSVDSARAHIQVIEPAYTITLTKSPTGTVEIDDSVTLTAKVVKKSDGSNATGTVTFSASGSAVALSASSAALTSGTAAITAYASKAGSSTVTATYSSGSTSYTASVSITVAEATSGDVEYYVDAEETVELDESDFQDFFEKTYKNGELSYVTFSTGSAKNYGTSSYGYLYESSERRADKVQSSVKYYYNTTSNNDLNSIEFRAGTRSTAYTVTVPFTARGEDKNGRDRSLSGTLTIRVNDGGKSSGDITYYVSSEETVSLSEDDFQSFFADKFSNGDLEYVKFTVGDATNYGTSSYGYLYESDAAKASKVSGSTRFYYDAGAKQDDLDAVVFTAGTRTNAYTVKIPFTATGKYRNATRSVDGTLVIEVNDRTSVTITTDGATFDELKLVKALTPKNVSSSKLDSYYVQFTKVTGGTLYDYYKTATNNEQWSRRDQFYFNAGSDQYALGDVFFLPKSTVKTAELSYTIYRESGKNAIEVDKGKIVFKVEQAKVTVTFNDIPANVKSWAGDAIEYMAKQGYVGGTGNKTFSPNANMSRAMLVTVLYRMAGEPSVSGIANPFKDVVKGTYYYNAVLWAYNKGIVTGKGADKFAPNDNVSRQEIAAFIYRYAGKPTATGTLTGFSDYAKVSGYATDAMKWATRNEIITGIGGKLVPTAAATRAQVVAMLYRYLNA